MDPAEARRALVLAGATRPEEIDTDPYGKAMEIDVAYGGITGATGVVLSLLWIPGGTPSTAVAA
jgi:hypothetical protein